MYGVGGLRSINPCTRCTRYRDACGAFVRALKDAELEARLGGLDQDHMPVVTVDCEGRFSPASLVHKGDQ